MQASEKTEFGVGRCQVVDEAQTVLLGDVGWLDAGFLANFTAHGSKRVGLSVFQAVTVALKEAADDVVASNVDIDATPFVEQDIAVARLYHRTDGKSIAEFLSRLASREL